MIEHTIGCLQAAIETNKGVMRGFRHNLQALEMPFVRAVALDDLMDELDQETHKLETLLKRLEDAVARRKEAQ